MQRINVLAIHRISPADRLKIEAVDRAIRLTDAGGWYDGEIRETWPAFTSARYLELESTGSGSREERDRLLAEAEVILGGWPFPLDLRSRAPRLKWFHQRPAGASNLLIGDLWRSDVVVTTSRGVGNTLAMAEYAVAGILHFAKGLHRASVDRDVASFDHRAYRPLLLEGKPHASWGWAASDATSGGYAPRSGCGSSARGAARIPRMPRRRGSESSAAPSTSIAS
jgi:hypothetical protein